MQKKLHALEGEKDDRLKQVEDWKRKLKEKDETLEVCTNRLNVYLIFERTENILSDSKVMYISAHRDSNLW